MTVLGYFAKPGQGQSVMQEDAQTIAKLIFEASKAGKQLGRLDFAFGGFGLAYEPIEVAGVKTDGDFYMVMAIRSQMFAPLVRVLNELLHGGRFPGQMLLAVQPASQWSEDGDSNQPIVFDGIIDDSDPQTWQAKYRQDFETTNDGEILLRWMAANDGDPVEFLRHKSGCKFTGLYLKHGVVYALTDGNHVDRGMALWYLCHPVTKSLFVSSCRSSLQLAIESAEVEPSMVIPMREVALEALWRAAANGVPDLCA